MKDYKATITTNKSIEIVYKAIAEEMSDWWTPMSNKFLKIGDQAKTDFGGESYWSFEATLLDNPRRIELVCHDAYRIHEGLSDNIRTEWLGTKLVFEIIEENEKTSIDFTHVGLVHELECYEVCKGGWDYFFLESLKKYINLKREIL